MIENEHVDASPADDRAIAVVGFAGRFPGAADVEALWRALRRGTDAIHRFTEDELRAAGVSQDELGDPDYVKARGIAPAAEDFDVAFFGLSPREAEVLDPQHRVFLEVAHDALEHAGYDPSRAGGLVGIYAGCGFNTYLPYHLMANPAVIEAVGEYQAMLANDKDFLPTRVSYLLDLKGPSLSVQTACSTSLVAVHMAALSLLELDCDLALAGGVSIPVPQHRGYLYRAGGILSPDGRCCPFTVDARGTVQGAGAGVVVLKRLDEALADRDAIYAVLRGTAVNNDGGGKVGFTAPGVRGQAEVIAAALAVAGVDPATVGYLEAHGTGTELGDPIEVEALKQVFAASPGERSRCALGSVKANLGHLDAAAGVAGLIKAVLMLHHRQLPPHPAGDAPAAALALDDSPFFLNGELRDWETPDFAPRRAGVSSFGIGGTNAHAVLEEAPPRPPGSASRAAQLVVVSARSATALDAATRRLGRYLEAQPRLELADVAHTLQVGRRVFEHRRFLVSTDRAAAATALKTLDAEPLRGNAGRVQAWPVVFLFPGQGAQAIGMGAGLHATEPTYRAAVDRCAEILLPRLGRDLRPLLSDPHAAVEAIILEDTTLAQPAIFTVEWALAELWQEWGVVPDAMVGHSIGELVAACRAGVFELEDALALVAARGRLMGSCAPGAMLTVALSESELAPHLGEGLELAAVNAPDLCVVSGPAPRVDALAERLEVETRRLRTSHAFHSAAMEPILDDFRREVEKVRLREPEGRFLANRSGTWAGAEVADPEYWVEHLRRPVRFADAVTTLLDEASWVFLEVGPGGSLGSLVRRQSLARQRAHVLTSLRSRDGSDDGTSMLKALGELWLEGRSLDWQGFYRHEARRRVALPTYPFERRRCFVEAGGPRWGAAPSAGTTPEATVAAGDGSSAALAERPALSTLYTAPRDAVEQQVLALWQDTLGIEQIGVHDDFFELGGHSLVATQLLARIRRATGRELPMTALFDRPTIAGVAAQLAALPEPAPDAEAISPMPRPEVIPLSFAQERLWFLDQLTPGDSAFHLPFAVRFEGRLDLPRLHAAVGAVARRHEALRTAFPAVAGGPRQEIVATVPVATVPVDAPLVDLTAVPETKRQDEATRRLEATARAPFDLAAGPLLRLLVLRVAEEDHRALLVLHHIVADGWSMGVFLRELAALYEGRELPALPLQYADYALWQRRRQTAERLAPLLAAARRRLAGAPSSLELAADRARPARPSLRGGLVRQRLEAGLRQGVEALAARHGLTPFMVLLAAFTAWLRRSTGQLDLVVGTPVASRDRPELEGLIGLFVNTLALRPGGQGPAADPRARELLETVRTETLAAFAEQELPFEKLVDELAPERDMGRTPLFQVMLALETPPAAHAALQLAGLRWTLVETDRVRTHFDLSLQLAESGDGFEGAWLFARDLFDRATVARAAGHFTRLLAGFVDRPDRRLSEAPMLSPAEAHQLLREWNVCPDYQAMERPVHQHFERQAAQCGQAPAVVFAGQTLSYRELDARANRLARYLRHRGVGPEVIVAVALERSFDLVVSLLAILKAGGAFLPIDPDWPEERARFMIEDARAKIQLAAGDLPAGEVEAAESDGDPPWAVALDHPAYVIYTSGSTGRPKGVVISHRAFANRMAWAREKDLEPGEAVLQKTTISFDVAVFEIFAPLLVGGTTVLARPGGTMDMAYLARLLAEQGIANASFPPSILTHLLEEPVFRAAPALKRVVTGGETVPAELAVSFFERMGVDLQNRYGPTEASISVTLWTCRRGIAERVLPIGRPIAGARLHLVDRAFAPVPMGAPGEIVIGGVCLARGYLGRPALTAAAFVPDRLSGSNGERLYRTGDLARTRTDGAFEFIGRLDQQVKIRGFRVELGEIEAELRRHPQVQEGAVLLRRDGGAPQLVAYTVAGPGGEELRRFLRGRLPDHMVPSVYVELAALPLSPTGKIDRQALPAPERSTAEAVAPRDAAEATLAAIWAELLGVDSVGAHDNFFELGGDSILTIQAVARAGQAGLRITPRQLFEYQTVADLARVAEPVSTRAEQGLVEGEVPLTPIQRWFFAQQLADPHHFNQAVVLGLRRELDPEQLAAAFDRLARHHDALRLRFKRTRAGWRQEHGHLAGAAPFTVIDLRGVPGAEPGAAAQLQGSLDLEAGPVLRAALLRDAQGPGRLLVIVHHLVIDGVSWRILLEDLERLVGQPSGQPVELPPKTTSFKEWAEKLAELPADAVDPSAWLPFEEASPSLPVDQPGGVAWTSSARTLERRLEAELTTELVQETVRIYNMKVDEVLIAALAETLLAWRGGSRYLDLDLESHGREDLVPADLSRTVGWFTALWPWRLDLSRAGRPGEVLKAVKESLRSAPRQGIDWGLARWGGRGEIELPAIAPQVGFNYLGRFETSEADLPAFILTSQSAGPATSPRARRTHLLDLNGAITEGCLELRWTFSEDVHRRETVEALADDFLHRLRGLMEHCRSPDAGGYTPSDFPDVDLDQDELDAILSRFD